MAYNEIKDQKETPPEEDLLKEFGKELVALRNDVNEALDTPEKMSDYLQGVLEKAKSIIKAQSEKAGSEYSGLEKTIFSEIEGIETKTLTKVLLREYVFKIADSIGYDYQIIKTDSGIVDEFGRTSHEINTDKNAGKIDLNIRGKYDESYKYFYPDPNIRGELKKIYDYSYIEEMELAKKIQKKTLSEENVEALENKLSQNNTLKKSENFDESTGPIVIIFEEEHKKGSVQQNYESLKEIYSSLDFLASESAVGEIKETMNNLFYRIRTGISTNYLGKAVICPPQGGFFLSLMG